MNTLQTKRTSRYLLPLFLLALSMGLWLAWRNIDPRLAAMKYITGASPRRTYTMGVHTLDFFESLHAALIYVVYIGLGCSLLTAIIAWLYPRWLKPATVFTLAAIVYAFSAGLFIDQQSEAPHYVYLADAFVHGRTHLEGTPPNVVENDWTYFQDQWYVSFPPTPAVLMMPFVAVWDTDFNDVIFTLLLGALNVALMYEMLGYVSVQGNPLQETVRIMLTIIFGFGTVHWWLASVGQVWLTAQIAATTFLILALRETLASGRPMWAATWLALAALARPPVLLALPALAWLLWPNNSPKNLLKGLIPLGVAAVLMGSYNYARFGNPIELGYRYMQLEELLAERMAEFGAFNLAYFQDNFYHAFLNIPEWRDRFPFLLMDGWGLSLFISTPILVYAFFAPWRERLSQACALAVLMIALPSLLYYNTGYLQAGYRYALDFIPFLILLVAMGMRGRLTVVSGALAILSVLMGFIMWANFIGLSLGVL